MSEYYEGKLICVDAGDKTGFDLDTMGGLTITSAGRVHARRLAACWNMFLGIDTDVIEIMPTFVEFQQANEQTLHETLCELNAARALLRGVRNVGITPKRWEKNSDTLEVRITQYLDACDTLEGK